MKILFWCNNRLSFIHVVWKAKANTYFGVIMSSQPVPHVEVENRERNINNLLDEVAKVYRPATCVDVETSSARDRKFEAEGFHRVYSNRWVDSPPARGRTMSLNYSCADSMRSADSAIKINQLEEALRRRDDELEDRDVWRLIWVWTTSIETVEGQMIVELKMWLKV